MIGRIQGTNGMSSPETLPNERLCKAAHEFEAMLLEEMLKPLSQHASLYGTGEEESSENPMESFGTQAIAGALSRSGALGFAARIEHALTEHPSRAEKSEKAIPQNGQLLAGKS